MFEHELLLCTQWSRWRNILGVTKYFNDIGTKWQKVHFVSFSSSKWILHNIHNFYSNTPHFSAIMKTRTKNCQSFSKSKSKPDITYIQNYSHWIWLTHCTYDSEFLPFSVKLSGDMVHPNPNIDIHVINVTSGNSTILHTHYQTEYCL